MRHDVRFLARAKTAFGLGIDPCCISGFCRPKRAIAVAKGQAAKLWELRATVSLARILGDQGKRSQALELLTPVVQSFPAGGRDLADMAEAGALLRELG